MDGPQTKTPSHRTLRRQQRKELIADLLHDIDVVERRLVAAEATGTKKEILAFQTLFDVLYTSYCDVINSEV